MESPVCKYCRKPKGAYECGNCSACLCKKCAEFVREEAFAFLEKRPAQILHTTYCPACFDSLVAPTLSAYQQDIERAREVIVYHKEQNEESRLIKRSEKPLVVADAADREEALLKLAFLAARGNFTTLVDVQIAPKKIKNEVYKTLRWQGSGIPARPSAETMSRVQWSAPTNNVGTR